MRRIAYAVLAAASTAALVLLAADAGVAWSAVALLWIAPDVTLLPGGGAGFAEGRLHPRAVPLYNAAHSLWGPALAAAAAAAGIVPDVIAVAWLSHITVDRALGFGRRTREGFQRA